MTNKIGLLFLSAVLMMTPVLASAATLTRQLELGMTGSDVSSLQTFLAKDQTIYPQGLVTGYFGSLTKSAVSNFQARNGIETVGRVGPVTLAAINAQMNGGTGGTVSGAYAPYISNLALSVASGSATISWNTLQAARGKVHYGTAFPSMTEGSATSQAQIGGAVVIEPTYGSAHSVVLTGLNSNTTYYYVVEAEDANGEQTIVWPATFKTQ